MWKARTISMLIALIVIVVVAVTLGVVLAGYTLSLFSTYNSKYIKVLKARYFYFTEKPPTILNKCQHPPCGIVIIRLYSSGKVRLTLIKYWNYTWKPEECKWRTSYRGYFDRGYNIIVLTDPMQATATIPACIVVSSEVDPATYRTFYDILISDGDTTSLTPNELFLLKVYADLSVSAIFSPTSLKIITADAGQYVVPVVPRRIG